MQYANENSTAAGRPAEPGVRGLKPSKPSKPQLRWLVRGAGQAGGKLPLFDEQGQRVSERTVRSCIEKGWAEPWFDNPIKPDWQVCKLTASGLAALEDKT